MRGDLHWPVAAGAALGLVFASSPIGATSSSNRQEAYDAAEAAFDNGDYKTAAAGFGGLLPAEHGAKLSRSQAVIAARLASALIGLNRMEEARSWSADAVASLPPDDDMLPSAWLIAGNAARFSFDYPAAATAYDKAASAATARNDLPSLYTAKIDFAYAAVTIDPVRVQNELDAFLGGPQAAALNKATLAQAEDMRARAAMNAGNEKEAARWIIRAVDHSGGLTATKVSAAQVAIRGDAAIIERLLGDDEEARKYLTYTGAGHMKDMNWIGRFHGELPVCGVDGDVQTGDSAVIEFALTDDGKVQAAVPVYASRPGTIGSTFAQAVNSWRWEPSALKDVEPFWRDTLRLELRCESRPRPESLGQPYFRDTVKWLLDKGIFTAGDTPSMPEEASDISAQQVGSQPVLRALFMPDPHKRGDPPPMSYDEAIRTLDAANAPASAYALLVLREASRGPAGDSVRDAQRARAAVMAPLVPPLARRFAGDPAMAWLTLEWALSLEDSGNFDGAQPLVRSVLDMPPIALPADSPVRRVALLHDALLRSKAGDAVAAQSSLAASGLNAEQCTLFDTHPVPESVSIASAQFPFDAMRWHFEGYVREAFDVTDSGRVANVRTIVAYPPFIFGPDTEKAVRTFRYVPPSIGGKAVGCSGETQAVSYRLPG